MGWIGHDLKTGEIICLGRWLVRFQFLGWATLTWGFINVCGCIKGKWFGLCTFRSGPFIELGSDWDKAFGKLGWDSK